MRHKYTGRPDPMSLMQQKYSFQCPYRNPIGLAAFEDSQMNNQRGGGGRGGEWRDRKGEELKREIWGEKKEKNEISKSEKAKHSLLGL